MPAILIRLARSWHCVLWPFAPSTGQLVELENSGIRERSCTQVGCQEHGGIGATTTQPQPATRKAQPPGPMPWCGGALTYLVLPALLPRGGEVRNSTSTCDQSWVVRTHGGGQPGHKRLTGCRHEQVARLLVPGRVLLGSMFDVRDEAHREEAD